VDIQGWQIMSEPVYLIINADDYGYFPCISQGILEAAQAGCLTATGILANSPDLNAQLECLDACSQLDLGVHLNLTYNRPLTKAMCEKLHRWNGKFPNVYLMSLLILTGKISIETVRNEWCAQIEACQSKKLVFLNSHEHIHMLPALFALTLELSKAYRIPHVRLTQAQWLSPYSASGLIRNSLMQTMNKINRLHSKQPTPIFLGLSHSGKLDISVLSRIFARLKAGAAYELMCHPGRFDAQQISDPKLVSYHAWESELTLLQSSQLKDLYKIFNIHLIHYHQL
jgi:predicted glycoside hydrolase/deacetylase ChbG (UPF0249 family)